MSPISPEMVAEALASHYVGEVPRPQLEKLSAYGNLIIRWNQKTNLTAIRDARSILERHIVESVAAAKLLPARIATLMDYGSGAGLPGVPIAIIRGEIRVTLAESQGKKAAFLREAVRTLDLHVDIHDGRVADLGTVQTFDAVTLRAVENMREAVMDARARVQSGGFLLIFATEDTKPTVLASARPISVSEHPLPTAGLLLICRV